MGTSRVRSSQEEGPRLTKGRRAFLKEDESVRARPVSCASNSNLFHMKDGLSPSHVVTALEKSWNPDGIGHEKTL